METPNTSEMVEKLRATRMDFLRTMISCVSSADFYLRDAMKTGVVTLDFENMFNGAAFYLQKIKEIDFTLTRLSMESKSKTSAE